MHPMLLLSGIMPRKRNLCKDPIFRETDSLIPLNTLDLTEKFIGGYLEKEGYFKSSSQRGGGKYGTF